MTQGFQKHGVQDQKVWCGNQPVAVLRALDKNQDLIDCNQNHPGRSEHPLPAQLSNHVWYPGNSESTPSSVDDFFVGIILSRGCNNPHELTRTGGGRTWARNAHRPTHRAIDIRSCNNEALIVSTTQVRSTRLEHGTKPTR